MNNVNIIGTITKDPELRYAPSGAGVATFSIAWNEKRKDANGQYVEKAHFFEVAAFGKTAENIQKYFNKGDKIGITGSLDYQSWQDQNGNNRSKVGIKLEKFDFIGSKSNNTQANQSHHQGYQQQKPTTQSSNTQTMPEIDIDDDEIPF